jgi:hypothetical protein
LGDYIIANGNNNGVGVAIARDKLDAKNIKNIVGIAWSASSDIQIKTVNVAVGLNVNDNQKFVEELETQVSQLKSEIVSVNTQLEKLVPGFKAPAGLVVSSTAVPNHAVAQTSTQKANSQYTVTPDESNVQYYQLTREDVMKGAELAQKHMKDLGQDIQNHAFWKKFNQDRGFQEETINKILNTYNDRVNQAKQVNKKR